MKHIMIFALLIVAMACKKDDVKEPMVETEPCLLLGYVTDTTGSGARVEIFYNKQDLISGTTYAYTGYFGDTTKMTSTVSYYDQQRPSVATNVVQEINVKFEYDANKVLVKKTWFEKETLPRYSTRFEWKAGKLDRIIQSSYEVTGAPGSTQNYKETEHSYAMLDIGDDGNLRTLKRFRMDGKALESYAFEYDKSPNPFRKLYAIQSTYFDQYAHLMSTNNITRTTIRYPEEQKEYVQDVKRAYNPAGYPLDGFYPSHRALALVYKCR
ncbi:hypothetical protein [Dyadobacter sp. CY326]|uniref:hypothetical protein n=1 Tax=Dyadobacter sp. CY326 TaxID=2907300 RepID=UPI001F33341F|nr:hypothetical protein [Dyadobacter sp. CY326]MCE7064570.1 hypothetical protein [Dyadobacter sp. CY326]